MTVGGRFGRVSSLILLSILGFGGCNTAYKKSLGGDTSKIFSKIYFTDFNTAWQSVLDSLKNTRLDVSNREGGFVQTRWTDNTVEKNFIESYGNTESFLKAQYRFKVTAAKGFFSGKPSVKISVFKEQLVQRDVLEGWRPVESDEIEENTLLYRIGRIIAMRTRITQLEEAKINQAVQSGTQAP